MRYPPTLNDNLTQQLTWTKPPENLLVIKKNSDTVVDSFVSIVAHLIAHKHLNVYIEENEYDSQLLSRHEQINEFKVQLKLRKLSSCECANQIDLIICLGGDGTLLHATTLFQVCIARNCFII